MSWIDPLFMSLRLECFKEKACTGGCAGKKCTGFHSWHDSRRPWNEIGYSKYLCEDTKCRDQKCCFSHNVIEEKYHPDNYKKKYCQEWVEKGGCKFGEVCALAHSDLELKIKPLHLMKIDLEFLLFRFKSEFCPFGKLPHDRFICVYAHNWQDFKRPYRDYSPEQCPHWNPENTLVRYEEACPLGFSCGYSHGWKEREFHPRLLKSAPCEASFCPRPQVCSFIHSEDRPRSLSQHPDFVPWSRQLKYNRSSIQEYLVFVEAPVLSTPATNGKESPKSFGSASTRFTHLSLVSLSTRNSRLLAVQEPQQKLENPSQVAPMESCTDSQVPSPEQHLPNSQFYKD